MSYYGNKTFTGVFSVSKQLLNAGSSYRFGGAHAQVAYAADGGALVEVTKHHSGVNVIQAATDTVSVAFTGIKQDAAAEFTDITFVDVTDSYTLPGDKHGILLEGSLVANGETLDANTNLFKLDPNTTVTGSGKLVVFTFVQP